MSDVTITLRHNGPLLVSGPAKLIDHEGKQFNLEGKATYALCRCGQSQKRPISAMGLTKAAGWVPKNGRCDGNETTGTPQRAPADS